MILSFDANRVYHHVGFQEMQNLESELKQWVGTTLGTQDFHFAPLQGDASFRTYYRVKHADESYIAMLAPPAKERTDAFVAIAQAWKQHDLCVPEVLAWHQQQGFVLLSDFGDTLLLDILNQESVDHFYKQAMQNIVALQHTTVPDFIIPPYNEEYVRLELGLFQEWFLSKLLDLELTQEIIHLYEKTMQKIIANFIHQPQVVVHRDFHSRNLMVLQNGTLGLIDFQDAMIGPITYDLVSLLKDCYITWPIHDVNRWVKYFFDLLVNEKKISPMDFSHFVKWFDWVGLQRHLKVLGIFSRLKLRDNKPHYLQHMSRILQYVVQVTSLYPELSEFHHFLQTNVAPVMHECVQQHLSGTQKVA
jgi:hypothetical protein